MEIEPKLIRKATFTPVSLHDSTQTEKLISCDEKASFGDKAYVGGHHKYSARHYGWFYGVPGKATRNQPLPGSQKNETKSSAALRQPWSIHLRG